MLQMVYDEIVLEGVFCLKNTESNEVILEAKKGEHPSVFMKKVVKAGVNVTTAHTLDYPEQDGWEFYSLVYYFNDGSGKSETGYYHPEQDISYSILVSGSRKRSEKKPYALFYDGGKKGIGNEDLAEFETEQQAKDALLDKVRRCKLRMLL